MIDTVDAVLLGDLHERTPTKCTVKRWSGPERLFRAAAVLVVCWALALASVPLLVIHFILIPLFLFGGLAGFFIVYVKRGIVEIDERCPHCNAELKRKLQLNAWPLYIICPQCKKTLALELASVLEGEGAKEHAATS